MPIATRPEHFTTTLPPQSDNVGHITAEFGLTHVRGISMALICFRVLQHRFLPCCMGAKQDQQELALHSNAPEHIIHLAVPASTGKC